MVGFDQHLQAVTVGGHESRKAPLLAQHFVEQPVIDMRWNAVDLVIRSHHTADAAFFHRGFERHKESFSDYALGDISRRSIRSAFWLPMDCKMLHRRHDVIAADEEVVAL